MHSPLQCDSTALSWSEEPLAHPHSHWIWAGLVAYSDPQKVPEAPTSCPEHAWTSRDLVCIHRGPWSSAQSPLARAQAGRLEGHRPPRAAEAIPDQPAPAGLAADCRYMRQPSQGQENDTVDTHPSCQPTELWSKSLAVVWSQGLANSSPSAESGVPPGFVNTVFLEHSLSQLFMYCLELLSHYKSRGE